MTSWMSSVEALERLTVIYLLRRGELERVGTEDSGMVRPDSFHEDEVGDGEFIRSSVRPLADEHVKAARQDLWMLGEQGRAIERYMLTRMTEDHSRRAGKARGLKYYRDRDVDITIEHVLPQNKQSDAAKPFSSVGRSKTTSISSAT